MQILTAVAVLIIGALIYVGLPILLVWGWMRWVKRSEHTNLSGTLSLVGFILATLSALLAASAIVYSLVIHGFPHYDPRLMKIYGIGALLSVGGLLFGFTGLRRPNPLRWHAPICALGMLFFWFMMALTE